MNKQRRTEVYKIVMELENLKTRLQKVLTEEEIVFDNMPENLQGSMRGEESEEAIEYMENSLESITEAIEELNEI